MKVTDLFWDSESLERKCVEIRVNSNDSIRELLAEIEMTQADYLVVKAPAGNFELNRALSDIGFFFTESMFSLRCNLGDTKVNMVTQRLSSHFSLELVPGNQSHLIIERMHEAAFATDRIALDSVFGPKVSNQRYIKWIEHELLNGGELLKLDRGGDIMGFIATKADGDEASPFLSATFKSAVYPGLGVVLIQKSLQHYREMGFKTVRADISSNNMAPLRVHLTLGFGIEHQVLIFVRHTNGLEGPLI